MTSVWTLILAAGAARRFGSPKALALYRGQTLLARARATAEQVSGPRVVVVTGAHAAALAPHLTDANVVYNSKWQSGMGSSLAAGVAAVRAYDESASTLVVMLVDQPGVTSDHLNKLVQHCKLGEQCCLTADLHGVIGAPAALSRRFFERVMTLESEQGVKSILLPHEIVTITNAEALRDIDEPKDLLREFEPIERGVYNHD